MAIVVKYRIGEVAKDFGVANKVINEIMAEYFAPPKNHQQILAPEELDVIFDYLTIHNQVESLEEIFAVPAPQQTETASAETEEKKKDGEKKSAAKAPVKSAPNQSKADRPAAATVSAQAFKKE